MSSVNLDLAQRAVNEALKAGAAKADAVVIESSDTTSAVRLGKLEGVTRSESRDLGLRVLLEDKKGLKTAIISTNDLLKDNIKKVAEDAVNIAKIAPADEWVDIAESSDICENVKDLDLYQKDHGTTVEELDQWAMEAESAATEVKGVTNSEGAQGSFAESDSAYAASNGFAKEYKATGFSVSVSVIAGSGTAMETDYDYSYTRNKGDMISPKEIGRSAGELTVARLNPKKISTRKVPIIFDKRVSKSLLSNLATAINGQAIAKQSSFLTNYMDKMIFPKNINIIDDPTLKRGLGSQPFDAEGLEGQKMHLVENGVLKSWILDLRSAKKLGLKSNGRASRAIGGHPSPSSTNVYMENGQRTKEELIKGVKEGLYLTDAFGMGVNDVTGDYSQGANGFWIENGELTYPVSEITVAGNLLEMFKNIIAGNDLEMRYSKNAPTLLIDGMTVAGS